MPDYRKMHQCAGHSTKVTALTDFEFRVWVQYRASADDFGVCPLSAAKLQGDSYRLAQAPARRVLAALWRLVEIGLCLVFEHQGHQYLCQATWQDYEDVRYPRRSLYPQPSAEIFPKLSRKTAELFRQSHGKVSEEFPKSFGEVSEKFPSPARAGARETLTLTETLTLPEAPARAETDHRDPPLVRRRNLYAAYEHPRFDVPGWWHAERVKGLPGGEAEMARFYEWLRGRVEASNERTEPRKAWLGAAWEAWLRETGGNAAPALDAAEAALRAEGYR